MIESSEHYSQRQEAVVNSDSKILLAHKNTRCDKIAAAEREELYESNLFRKTIALAWN